MLMDGILFFPIRVLSEEIRNKDRVAREFPKT